MRTLRAVPFGVVLLVSAYSFLSPSQDLPSGVHIWDKLGHALLFAGLAVTARLAGPRAAVAGVALLGYGVLVEVLQATLPIHRDGDWHDVVADLVGILVGLLVAEVSRRLLPAAAPKGRSLGRRHG